MKKLLLIGLVLLMVFVMTAATRKVTGYCDKFYYAKNSSDSVYVYRHTVCRDLNLKVTSDKTKLVKEYYYQFVYVY
mgnify:CR=1 FL=1